MPHRISLIDTLLFPLFMLGYSYAKFEFNFPLYFTRTTYLEEGTFDDDARILADPVVVSIFTASFDSVRVFSVAQAFSRLIQNALFSFRVQSVVFDIRRAIEHPEVIRKHLEEQKRLSKGVGFAFLLYAVGLVILVTQAIHTTSSQCEPIAFCRRFAYRVQVANGTCPCIYAVDRRLTVKSLYDWQHMDDVTDMLEQLAMPGVLEGIDLINVKLRNFPDALRGNNGLREL